MELKHFIPMLPAVAIWGFLFWKTKIWMKIMDAFKEGLSFEKALEALKQGKSIRRKRSNYGLTKMIVSALGENKEKFCEYSLEKKDRLRENPVLSIEEILANDWLIEGQIALLRNELKYPSLEGLSGLGISLINIR